MVSGLGGVIILQSPWKVKMNRIFFFLIDSYSEHRQSGETAL